MAIQKKSLKAETTTVAAKPERAAQKAVNPDVRLTKRHNLAAWPPDPCRS